MLLARVGRRVVGRAHPGDQGRHERRAPQPQRRRLVRGRDRRRAGDRRCRAPDLHRGDVRSRPVRHLDDAELVAHGARDPRHGAGCGGGVRRERGGDEHRRATRHPSPSTSPAPTRCPALQSWRRSAELDRAAGRVTIADAWQLDAVDGCRARAADDRAAARRRRACDSRPARRASRRSTARRRSSCAGRPSSRRRSPSGHWTIRC